jgi:pimeloyl-ACP methyl ester carboxylesterase
VFFAFASITINIVRLLCNWTEQNKYKQQVIDQIQELTQKEVKEVGGKSETITLNNQIKLHVVTAGPEDGELMILLHGFPENWLAWKAQIPLFAGLGYHVVVPDMRGYNLSEKPQGIENYTLDKLTDDVKNLIEHFGRKNCILMAHDWGAAVAWRFAMDYPEMVTKLVILNGPHPATMLKVIKTSWKQRLMSWYIFFFQLPYLPELMFTLNAKGMLNNMFKKIPGFEDSDLKYYESAWLQPRAMTSMMNYYRAIRYARGDKARSKVIQTPTLVIWGDADEALSVDMATSLGEKWVPNVKLEILPGISHWLTHQAPIAIEDLVPHFFK